MKKVRGRLLLLLLVLVVSVICFFPSIPDWWQTLPAWAKSIMPNKGIALGLDLQGGIHLVMEVDEDRAVEIAVDRSVVALQDALVEKKIPVESVKRTSPIHGSFSAQTTKDGALASPSGCRSPPIGTPLA